MKRLLELEKRYQRVTGDSMAHQTPIFATRDDTTIKTAIERLRELDPNSISPREALAILFELRQMVGPVSQSY